MIEEAYIAIAGLIAILAAVYRAFQSKLSSDKPDKGPPANKVADVAIDNIQESLKEEIDRIKSATTGDSPADDLADLGNARRRR